MFFWDLSDPWRSNTGTMLQNKKKADNMKNKCFLVLRICYLLPPTPASHKGSKGKLQDSSRCSTHLRKSWLAGLSLSLSKMDQTATLILDFPFQSFVACRGWVGGEEEISAKLKNMSYFICSFLICLCLIYVHYAFCCVIALCWFQYLFNKMNITLLIII